jgi:hypothetical protein
MRRIALALALLLVPAAAPAQSGTKPTAREKMTSPSERARMAECEKDAAQQNVPMNARAKFVMDCMQRPKSR